MTAFMPLICLGIQSQRVRSCCAQGLYMNADGATACVLANTVMRTMSRGLSVTSLCVSRDVQGAAYKGE